MANENKKENGSLLVLTLISVMILSLLMIGLLTVGTTELQTTQNYQLNKNAYYAAVQGVEEIRDMIHQNPDAASVTAITKSKSETTASDNFGDVSIGTSRAYIIGTLKDWEENTTQLIDRFKGFDPPPLRGISAGVDPVVWKVPITASASMGNRIGYSEIEAGVYSFIETGYN
ncbi:MAG: hypothetical protein QG657_108 [Acidobacteriota bacterium]|nr:hypothetical protein [Acidobacteriota bacterium]